MYRQDRFINFANEFYTEERVVEQINRNLKMLDDNFPGLIQEYATLKMSQNQMNALHVYFEKYRGPFLNPSAVYANSSDEIREALDDLNLMIHRYEDLGYSGRQMSEHPKFYVTFGLNELNQRKPLFEEDFSEFTLECEFGQWMLDYCEVGKTFFDLWRDGDEIIGDEAILPLRYYSSEGSVYFGPDSREEDVLKFQSEMNKWWDQNAEKLQELGFTKDDPKNAIGSIIVADLDRNNPNINGMTNSEIVDLISRYQWIESVSWQSPVSIAPSQVVREYQNGI